LDGAVLESTNFEGANYDSHTLDTISKDAKNQLKKQGKKW
jgi:hypothetical protein